MEIKTVNELKAAYPELTAQIENAAIAAERKRIKDIESVSLAGYEKITNAAKFENPISSGELAMQIIAEQKKQKAAYTANVEADVADSGVNDVSPENHEAANNAADSKEDPFMKAINKVLPERKEG